MIIDAHVHARGKVFQNDNRGGVGSLLDMMGENGIDKAVVMGLATDDQPDLLAEISRYPQQLLPFVLILPEQKDLPGIYDRCSAVANLAGIGEIYAQPGPTQTHLEYMAPVLEIARRNRLPVLFHTGDFSYTAPIMLMEIFAAYPDINFIIGHMGSHHFLLDTIELLKSYPNVYTDTSGMQSPLMLRRAIAECGAEKILYGSDYPFWDPRVEIARIRSAQLDEKTEKMVLGENAARIFQF